MERTYFQNPVLDGDYPDPSVCRVGQDYYLTVSTGRQYPGLTIYHSRNLLDWEFACNPLRDFAGDVWAPDLVFHQGKFYIYFCASGSNWVIYSEQIGTGWSGAIDLKVGRIDPGHCVDEEGKRYLFLSGGYLVSLSDDGLSVAGEMEKVMEPMPIPVEWEVEGYFPESPKLTKRGEWYYMTYANGGTAGPATSHMVVSARAKNLRGPWEHSPFYPVIRTKSREEHWHSKGHGELVEDIEGNWWVLYHAYEKGYSCQGRKLLLEKIVWTEDGWFHTDENGSAEGNEVRPAGSEIEGSVGLHADFTAGNLGIWKSWGDISCERYQKRGNGVILSGIGRCPGESKPLTVACGFHSYQADTAVTVEDGCEAGIILFYDDRYYDGIGFDGSTIKIYRIGQVLAVAGVRADRLFLRMENRENYLSFSYSLDGIWYGKLNYVIDVEPQNNNAYGGFRALRPGVFACGNGNAYFSEFSLKKQM